MSDNMITTSELSYKISLARKNLTKKYRYADHPYHHALYECFVEIRRVLALRKRGRK